MKRILVLLALVMMTASLSFAGEWVGYLTDLKCAKAGKAGEGHKQCAQNCVKAGQPVALVTEGDNKVFEIHNQDAVMDHVGEKVTVSGKLMGESIHVDSVKM